MVSGIIVCSEGWLASSREDVCKIYRVVKNVPGLDEKSLALLCYESNGGFYPYTRVRCNNAGCCRLDSYWVCREVVCSDKLPGNPPTMEEVEALRAEYPAGTRVAYGAGMVRAVEPTEGKRRQRVKKIKIQYLDDSIERLRYIDGKSDWIDLRAEEEVAMKAGEFALIPLGVAMQLPEGYEAHIVPRSSTFKNFGIIQTNHTGIVDNSYCGPNDWWYMAAYALRGTVIHKNDRICQFRIVENQPLLSFEEVDRLAGVNRGGIGSTGTR